MSVQVPQILDSEGVPCGMCVIKTKNNKNDKSELPPGTFCSCVCIVCMRERERDTHTHSHNVFAPCIRTSVASSLFWSASSALPSPLPSLMCEELRSFSSDLQVLNALCSKARKCTLCMLTLSDGVKSGVRKPAIVLGLCVCL